MDILRDFCTEQSIKYFYDIKDLGNFKVHVLLCSLKLCFFVGFHVHMEKDLIYLIFCCMNLQANPDYKGVCHVALAQEGHCRPGEVIMYLSINCLNRYWNYLIQLDVLAISNCLIPSHTFRYCWVLILTHVLLEHLASLLLELAILMLVLFWALESFCLRS